MKYDHPGAGAIVNMNVVSAPDQIIDYNNTKHEQDNYCISNHVPNKILL